MPKFIWKAALSPLFLAALVATPLGAQVESVTRLTAHPSRFGRLDFVVMLKAEWQDPYHADDIRLDLELTAPSGRSLVVPCFYERGVSGASSEWLARYAPGEAGKYRGQVVLVVHGVRQAPVPVAFAVAASGARGFLHAAGPWMFRFDNGEPFRGIGENLCWEARSPDDSAFFKALNEDPRFNYEYLLGRLAASGGNFFRTWMCPWNLPLEWHKVSDTSRYTDDPARFNASAIRRMDELVDLAGSTDTYFMLTIDPHGAFLGRGWDLNSYNAANGGPVATPAEFFTDPAARARYRDKLRYLVARWGWSPHLAVWEFFNEIDNAMYGQKPARIPDAVITAWHAEMSAYLKAVDPYGRLVTTSVSHRDVAGMNQIPTMDFSQRHIYRNTPSIPGTIRQYVLSEGKPYVIGEFAREWDWSRDFNAIAADMDHDYKLGPWLGLFSPTPILPMSWWWEFFDERRLTASLARVRAVSDRMIAAGHGDFQGIACAWSGPALPVYGVQCGRTLFVLLVNEGASPAAGEVAMPPALTGRYASQEFDTETGQLTRAAPTDREHRDAVPATVAPGRLAVLIISPAP